MIQDQVNRLISIGVPTLSFSGDQNAQQKTFAYNELSANVIKAKLVYVTPELIMKSDKFQNTMKQLYKRGKLARFVIDEAHCVSAWGHDFRPDYKVVNL